MPLTPAKCPNCGSNLTVDSSKDAAICEYCGTPFIVEKAVNHYNTTVNIGEGAHVHMHIKNSGFKIEAGLLKKYTGSATEVVVPDGVREIGAKAFSEQQYITSVILPDGLQVIGDFAFYNCSGLTDINIPGSVTSIGESAFEDCTGLTSIHIPDSVTSIGICAFDGCSGLTSVNIPDSVTEIHDSAFQYCPNLVTLTGCKNVRMVGFAVFKGCSLDKKSVPPVIRQDWKKATGQEGPGCYIATAVYGSYDCPEVWTLRRYRDNNLQKSFFGRLFVKVYYAVSPTLVKWFGKTKAFNRFWRGRLDKMVNRLREKGYDDTPYKD